MNPPHCCGPCLRWRIETLKEISRCGVYAVPGTGHDVTEDIRYSGQSEQ